MRFEWITGVHRPIFNSVHLTGSWNISGHYAESWTTIAMMPFAAEDDCPAWAAEVDLNAAEAGWTFYWGILVNGSGRGPTWGVPTEESDTTARRLSFVLPLQGGTQRCWLTNSRRLGANKVLHDGKTGIRFTVLAPNAQKVELVTGDPVSGYIYNDGRGVQRSFPMKDVDGLWSTAADPDFAHFADWEHVPYMFRIERDDGSFAYRTDLYSRCQIGSGHLDPEKPLAGADPLWNGTRQDLKGTKSCSVVINPETVTARLDDPAFPPTDWLDEATFWADEFDPLRPVPDRLEELVIYELHVEGLFSGSARPATFTQAIALLDHLVDLGINAVELLPAAEAESWTWGYGTSHHFATEYAGGGRDNFKHFVRACHQRGIAVLLDVVYNHFVADSERSEWLYDTAAHEKSPYYWYEGSPQNWPAPDGGYIDNGSTGYTPNFRSNWVRKLFTSSAATWLTEFHLDGFRVDLTQAMHRDNVRHADGAPVPEANRFGAKLLREWVATLRLIRPSVMLTAEDHTGWRAITQPQAVGGIGFDAAWWAEYYHNLIGDSQADPGNARLIYQAGLGGDGPLAMGRFANTLAATTARVIYHESHDQAGNATYNFGGQKVASARTIVVAVNDQLDAASRPWAEARCRVAAGLTLTAPGVPMFFMGEEVGAREPYRYNDWIDHREDFLALKASDGAKLFAFYRDVIGLRRSSVALRAGSVNILHAHDANRVLAFRRTAGDDDVIVVASLSNSAFIDGYWLDSGAIPDGAWTTALNSDAAAYGGGGICNPLALTSAGGRLNMRLPANSLQILRRL